MAGVGSNVSRMRAVLEKHLPYLTHLFDYKTPVFKAYPTLRLCGFCVDGPFYFMRVYRNNAHQLIKVVGTTRGKVHILATKALHIIRQCTNIKVAAFNDMDSFRHKACVASVEGIIAELKRGTAIQLSTTHLPQQIKAFRDLGVPLPPLRQCELRWDKEAAKPCLMRYLKVSDISLKAPTMPNWLKFRKAYVLDGLRIFSETQTLHVTLHPCLCNMRRNFQRLPFQRDAHGFISTFNHVSCRHCVAVCCMCVAYQCRRFARRGVWS